ncbi:methyltransferase domain-containing protein [Gammaproteobacteria bacterium]|nr:methyltransferase domain-containing protein [Gammaproteobacteria bacterium]
MAKDFSEILRRVSSLEQDDSSRDIYDDWSSDYDAHLQREFGYISPRVAASELAQRLQQADLEIIDFGCGTGLVGEALREQGFVNIDGADISGGMLEQARAKQVYRNLLCADLTARIPLEDGCYGAGLCVGSLGGGHVGARHIPEMLRPIKRGGLFVLTMNGTYYESGGFEPAFRQMQDDGLWAIHKLEEFNYMTELVRPGWLLVSVKL